MIEYKFFAPVKPCKTLRARLLVLQMRLLVMLAPRNTLLEMYKKSDHTTHAHVVMADELLRRYLKLVPDKMNAEADRLRHKGVHTARKLIGEHGLDVFLLATNNKLDNEPMSRLDLSFYEGVQDEISNHINQTEKHHA